MIMMNDNGELQVCAKLKPRPLKGIYGKNSIGYLTFDVIDGFRNSIEQSLKIIHSLVN